jgi:hypothetical protein
MTTDMSERQKKILGEFDSGIVDTDVSASIVNFGKVIAKYGREIDEDEVVFGVFRAVFRKYSALRVTAKENREKLIHERNEHEKTKINVKELGGEKALLEIEVKSLLKKLQKTEKKQLELTGKVKLLENENHFLKPFAGAQFDKSGGAWLSTQKRSGPQTSTQVDHPRAKKSKKDDEPQVVFVSETCQSTQMIDDE